MKKAILTISLLLCTLFFLILVWPTQPVSFREIPVLEANALDDLIAGRTEASNILSFQCHAGNEALPIDKQSRTWYTPALTKELALDLPWPWHVARTETTADPTDGDTCRILFYNNRHCFEYTLVETGLPVVSIQLRRFDLNPKFIETWRTPATARILSLSADGTLQWQTEQVDIKARGDSSRHFYPKSSYTIFFLDESGNDALRTPLELPADRKFALNALYEDDSKIRDALSMHVAAQIRPQNGLQITYTELILNDAYYGLYGMHTIITENVLRTQPDDTVYKINLGTFSFSMPPYEIAVGDPQNEAPLQTFIDYFSSPTGGFPENCDYESFVDYIVTMEIIANTDARLKNMVFTHRAATDLLELCAWDMDLTFGFVWLDTPPLYFGADPALTEFRYTAFSPDTQFEPLGILYKSLPTLQQDIAARYRELRKTVFTDEALLQKAKSLYDPLTACGARQRDAERWPGSATSTDNNFIEEFIPARMAFLDSVFGAE